ncbi:MAG: AAA domain-containing protein, partial [Olpidium bornovanus]
AEEKRKETAKAIWEDRSPSTPKLKKPSGSPAAPLPPLNVSKTKTKAGRGRERGRESDPPEQKGRLPNPPAPSSETPRRTHRTPETATVRAVLGAASQATRKSKLSLRAADSILITGTPGCGKTSTAELLASQSGLTHIDVGALVKSKCLHQGWDEELDTHILDDDKVLFRVAILPGEQQLWLTFPTIVCGRLSVPHLVDELEDVVADGGKIVDFHSCGVFPERWFDLVVVLRADNKNLYDRLVSRRYNQKKIEENVECEIMQVVLEEAREW